MSAIENQSSSPALPRASADTPSLTLLNPDGVRGMMLRKLTQIPARKSKQARLMEAT